MLTDLGLSDRYEHKTHFCSYFLEVVHRLISNYLGGISFGIHFEYVHYRWSVLSYTW